MQLPLYHGRLLNALLLEFPAGAKRTGYCDAVLEREESMLVVRPGRVGGVVCAGAGDES